MTSPGKTGLAHHAALSMGILGALSVVACNRLTTNSDLAWDDNDTITIDPAPTDELLVRIRNCFSAHNIQTLWPTWPIAPRSWSVGDNPQTITIPSIAFPDQFQYHIAAAAPSDDAPTRPRLFYIIRDNGFVGDSQTRGPFILDENGTIKPAS